MNPGRQKPLVLLVDDEEIFLEIASVALRSSGFETVLTTDVRDAIAKAETLRPDLILSDIYMPPGPTGWEFALELHRNPKTQDIKVAFFTSLKDPWLELRANRDAIVRELGNVIFLSKMDDVGVLSKRIAAMIK